MGSTSILTAVIVLLVLSSVSLVIQAIWQHEKARAMFFTGVFFLVTYLIVQVLAWKDLSEVQAADSINPIWGMAGFSSGAYDATAWIGLVLVAVGGLVCFAQWRRAKKSTGVAA